MKARPAKRARRGTGSAAALETAPPTGASPPQASVPQPASSSSPATPPNCQPAAEDAPGSGSRGRRAAPWPPGASPFERLPGDLMSRILQLLTLREAFRARRVSRAIRDAVEATAFDGASLEVRCRAETQLQWTAALSKLEQLVRSGRLKGGGLSVSVECSGTLSSIGKQPAGLLSALAGRCWSARVHFLFADAADHVLRRHVVEVVDALADVDEGPSPLEELELLSTIRRDSSCWRPFLIKIPADSLTPFSALRALRFGHNAEASADTLRAVGKHLRNLRRLQLGTEPERHDHLSLLGPLASLEHLAVQELNRHAGVSFSKLASTPAGDSLREVRITLDTTPPQQESIGVEHGRPCLRQRDVDALAQMPHLERISGFPMPDVASLGLLGLARLLRAPSLRFLELSVHDYNAALCVLRSLDSALEEAGGQLPLKSLALHFDTRIPPEYTANAISRAGPLLTSVDFSSAFRVTLQPFALDHRVADAILLCPRLERLGLRCDVTSPEHVAPAAASFAPFAALPPLPGGLRVRVGVRSARLQLTELLVQQAMAALPAALPAATFEILRIL